MNVGVISNFYPPLVHGGYEIGCAQIAEGLRASGLQVEVLTSAMPGREATAHVHRWLATSFGRSLASMPPLQKLAYVACHEHHNLRAFHRFLNEANPDVIYFWNLSHTSHSLLDASLCSGVPTGLFAFDYGLTDAGSDVWNDQVRSVPGSISRNTQRCFLDLIGTLIRRPSPNLHPLDFIHYPTYFLKARLMKAGFTAKQWVPTQWGVDADCFQPGAQQTFDRLLYVGQVAEHKGVHVAIEALGKIRSSGLFPSLQMTVAGQCLSKNYRCKLDALVDQWGLRDAVEFVGFKSRNDLPELYSRHSILVFPSQWEEPMGIVILEAMACGLAVVSSGAGGSRELTRDGEDGVIFIKGDAQDCAQKIGQLLGNRLLLEEIRLNARKSVLDRFRLKNTVDLIANDLLARNCREKAVNL